MCGTMYVDSVANTLRKHKLQLLKDVSRSCCRSVLSSVICMSLLSITWENQQVYGTRVEVKQELRGFAGRIPSATQARRARAYITVPDSGSRTRRSIYLAATSMWQATLYIHYQMDIWLTREPIIEFLVASKHLT